MPDATARPAAARPATPVYMPQLDGVRAFAVLLVIVSHWMPEALPTGITGPTGVRLSSRSAVCSSPEFCSMPDSVQS